MRDLHVGRGVTWPAAIASQAIGVLGMRGAGKSNLGRVYAEELFESKVPLVVFDPVGAWYGIRAGRDGKAGGGLPVPIFGGEHGDLPLDRSSGEKVADLVIDRQLSCVLDLSHENFSETDKQVFLAAFGDRLYRRKKRETGWLALILEEADDYAPQPRSGGGGVKGPAAATLGVFQRLVRRGRSRGLGALMISQRSAAINKDLLYMVGALVAFRTTGPRDQEAIDGWLKYNQPEIRERVMGSLATLEDGEAWVIAQEALGSIEKVRIRRMATYDTGATPEHAGEGKHATLADIDVPALSKELAVAVEKAKAEDPRELRRTIVDLRAQLAKAQAAKPAPPAPASKVPRVVEKPVLKDAQVKRLEAAVERLLTETARMGDHLAQRQQVVVTEAGTVRAALAAARDTQARVGARAVGGGPVPPFRPAPVVPRVPRENEDLDDDDIDVGGGDESAPRRVLRALAQHGELDSRKLAILAGIKRGGSTFRGAIAKGRNEGLIEKGRLALTVAGAEAMRGAPGLPRGKGLRAYWAKRLGDGAPGRVYRQLIARWPDQWRPEDLATAASTSDRPLVVGGSTWRGALAKLRALDLTAPGRVLKASDELFDE